MHDPAHDPLNAPRFLNAEVVGVVTVPDKIVEKEALVKCFQILEEQRLIVGDVLMPPTALSMIRSYSPEIITEERRGEIRKTGYIGTLWGAGFWIDGAFPRNVVAAFGDDRKKVALLVFGI